MRPQSKVQTVLRGATGPRIFFQISHPTDLGRSKESCLSVANPGGDELAGDHVFFMFPCRAEMLCSYANVSSVPVIAVNQRFILI